MPYAVLLLLLLLPPPLWLLRWRWLLVLLR